MSYVKFVSFSAEMSPAEHGRDTGGTHGRHTRAGNDLGREVGQSLRWDFSVYEICNDSDRFAMIRP